MIDFRERNYGCRGRQVIYRGLKTVMLENEKIRVTIIADKGTDILEFLYKPLDVDYLWRSPLELKDPSNFIPSIARSDGAFMDYYEGGWTEALPHGGMQTVYKGAEFGQTGETALIPWEYEIKEDNPERVEVLFQVRTYRTPFFLQKWIWLEKGKPVLFIKERLVNEGGEDMDLMWIQHPVYGPPFLDENCVIDTNATRIRTLEEEWFVSSRLEKGTTSEWPLALGKGKTQVDVSTIPPPSSKTSELAFFDQFEDETGWYGITNTKRKVGIGLAWPVERFPYILMWQDCKGSMGQPWYGRIYCTALELWSSYPVGLLEVIKAGTQIVLKPGEETESRLVAVAYSDLERISKVSLEGEVFPK